MNLDEPQSEVANAKYGTETSLMGTLLGVPAAAIVDTGVTIWNSVTPEKYNYDTHDVLMGMNENLANVYNENPEVVSGLSFVGGILLPGAVAIKGMGMLRAGVKGANWFSAAGQAERLAGLQAAYKDSVGASNSVRGMLTKETFVTAGNALVDSTVLEGVLLMTMNAHPYMEDYVKDPWSHAGLNILAGTGLIGTVGLIQLGRQVKNIKQSVGFTAMETALEDTKAYDITKNTSEQIAIRADNAANWDNMLLNPALDAHTKGLVNFYSQASRADTFTLLDSMATGNFTGILKALPVSVAQPYRNGLIGKMTSEPTRFSGIDTISFYKGSDLADITKAKNTGSALHSSTTLPQESIPLVHTLKSGPRAGELSKTSLVYSPVHDAFLLPSDMRFYGRAADAGFTESNLMAGIPKAWHTHPNYDIGMELNAMSSSAIDAHYLRGLKYFDELPVEAFQESIVIAPDDYGMIQGLLARVQKEAGIAGSALDSTKIQVTLTKAKPNWDQINTDVVAKAVANHIPVNTISSTVSSTTQTTFPPAKPGTFSFIEKHLRSALGSSHDLMRAGKDLSPQAFKLANAFSGYAADSSTLPFGGMHLMERGLQDWRRAGPGRKAPQRLLTEEEALVFGNHNYRAARAGGMSHVEAMNRLGHEQSMLGDVVEELYNSAQSRGLRSTLQSTADSEGYVYLYRGLHGTPSGSRAGESFTPSLAIADRFGPANIHRIHVDDIVGYLGSYNGSKIGGELELIVDTASHPVVKSLPTGKTQTATQAAAVASIDPNVLAGIIKSNINKGESLTYGISDLMDHLQQAKFADVEALLKKGVPPEVVSTYLNMPVDTVRAVAAGAASHQYTQMDHILYSSADQIPDLLDISKRSLLLGTNAKKIPHAQARANIGTTLMNQSEDLIKQGIFSSAGQVSEYFDLWNKYFNSSSFTYVRDILRQNLSKIVNEGMGFRFTGSADNALRDMGDVGRIATHIGKSIDELHSKAVTKMFDPIKSDLNSMVADTAGLTEYNIAKHVYSKTKGYLEYANGQIFVQDANTPMKVIGKDAKGKDIMGRNMIPVDYEGAPFTITTPSVQRVMEWHQNIGRELFFQANTLKSIPGVGNLNDRGLWIPSMNLKGKQIAYVINKSTLETTLLHGKTEADLNAAISFFSNKNGVLIGNTHDIIRRGTDQQMYNIIAGRHDPMFMASADITQLHGGASAEARISTNSEGLIDSVNAIEHQLRYHIGSMVELQLADVFDHLSTYSKMAQSAVKGQPIDKYLMQTKDAADVVKNTILGKGMANSNYLWRGVNEIYTAVLEKTFTTLADIVEPVFNAAGKIIGKGKTISDAKYEELEKEMRSRGIPFIFDSYNKAEAQQLFHADRTAKVEALAPRMTVLSNTLAATALLRVGEVGQAYVNAISLPILMTSEISSKLPQQFMNADLVGSPNLGVAKTIINGFRFIFTPEGKQVIALGADKNLFKGVISEVDALFQQTRSLDPGVLSSVEGAIRSKVVENLSFFTNKSEEYVREMAFSTGWYISKQAYPTLPNAGRTIFAEDFMNRVIGNYTASQRPTMFQGTFGTAMGLFQTYMVTMAQAMYRHIEIGDFKALAKMMLVQGGVFGAKSLPGFNIVSEAIGEHFSDRNVDLTTGTFRALPTTLAEGIIYGLPSTFGQAAVTSRGDIQPRLPNPTLGVEAIPAINITAQAWKAMAKVATSVFSVDQTAGQGIMEALSMQSISRPIARLSELASGHSVTARGNLIAGPDEIWTWNSVVARLMSTRPTSEARARDALHLNTLYGSLDRDHRAQISMRLRSHMRGGTLDHEVVADLAREYMRTGSPTGWNSIVNSAIGQTQLPAEATVRNYLAPDSPTLAMINNMY